MKPVRLINGNEIWFNREAVGYSTWELDEALDELDSRSRLLGIDIPNYDNCYIELSDKSYITFRYTDFADDCMCVLLDDTVVEVPSFIETIEVFVKNDSGKASIDLEKHWDSMYYDKKWKQVSITTSEGCKKLRLDLKCHRQISLVINGKEFIEGVGQEELDEIELSATGDSSEYTQLDFASYMHIDKVTIAKFENIIFGVCNILNKSITNAMVMNERQSKMFTDMMRLLGYNSNWVDKEIVRLNTAFLWIHKVIYAYDSNDKRWSYTFRDSDKIVTNKEFIGFLLLLQGDLTGKVI